MNGREARAGTGARDVRTPIAQEAVNQVSSWTSNENTPTPSSKVGTSFVVEVTSNAAAHILNNPSELKDFARSIVRLAAIESSLECQVVFLGELINLDAQYPNAITKQANALFLSMIARQTKSNPNAVVYSFSIQSQDQYTADICSYTLKRLFESLGNNIGDSNINRLTSSERSAIYNIFATSCKSQISKILTRALHHDKDEQALISAFFALNHRSTFCSASNLALKDILQNDGVKIAELLEGFLNQEPLPNICQFKELDHGNALNFLSINFPDKINSILSRLGQLMRTSTDSRTVDTSIKLLKTVASNPLSYSPAQEAFHILRFNQAELEAEAYCNGARDARLMAFAELTIVYAKPNIPKEAQSRFESALNNLNSHFLGASFLIKALAISSEVPNNFFDKIATNNARQIIEYIFNRGEQLASHDIATLAFLFDASHSNYKNAGITELMIGFLRELTQREFEYGNPMNSVNAIKLFLGATSSKQAITAAITELATIANNSQKRLDTSNVRNRANIEKALHEAKLTIMNLFKYPTKGLKQLNRNFILSFPKTDRKRIVANNYSQESISTTRRRAAEQLMTNLNNWNLSNEPKIHSRLVITLGIIRYCRITIPTYIQKLTDIHFSSTKASLYKYRGKVVETISSLNELRLKIYGSTFPKSQKDSKPNSKGFGPFIIA